MSVSLSLLFCGGVACSVSAAPLSPPLPVTHMSVCVKEGQASCQDVGSSWGTVALSQTSQLSAETECIGG